MTKIDFDKKLNSLLIKLLDWARNNSSQFRKEFISDIYRPENNSAEWNDQDNVAKWFKRDDINQAAVDALQKNDTTFGDRIVSFLQIELMSIMERAFKNRYYNSYVQAVADTAWRTEILSKSFQNGYIDWLSDEIRVAKEKRIE